MWATLLSLLSKVNFKIVAIIGGILVVGIYILTLHHQISNYKDTILELNTTIDDQKVEISALNLQVKNQIAVTKAEEQTTKLTNEKLSKCYELLDQRQEALSEIETIMAMQDEAEATTVNSLTDESLSEDTSVTPSCPLCPTLAAPAYKSVTKTQMKLGLEFVNKQILRLGGDK